MQEYASNAGEWADNATPCLHDCCLTLALFATALQARFQILPRSVAPLWHLCVPEDAQHSMLWTVAAFPASTCLPASPVGLSLKAMLGLVLAVQDLLICFDMGSCLDIGSSGCCISGQCQDNCRIIMAQQRMDLFCRMLPFAS